MCLTVKLTRYELTGSVTILMCLILVNTDTQPVHIDDGLDTHHLLIRRHSDMPGLHQTEHDKSIHPAFDLTHDLLRHTEPRTCYDLRQPHLIFETDTIIRHSDDRLELIIIDMF